MKAKTSKKQSKTDWKRLEEMKDKDIDLSDCPEMGADFFKNAELIMPAEKKIPVTIRLDKPILDWFKDQGKGYQTKINAILKAYVLTRSSNPPLEG